MTRSKVAQRALDAYRDGRGPEAAARAQAWRALQQRLAAGELPTSLSAAPSPTAFRARGTLFGKGPLLGWLGASVGVMTALFMLQGRVAQDARARPAATATVPASPKPEAPIQAADAPPSSAPRMATGESDRETRVPRATAAARKQSRAAPPRRADAPVVLPAAASGTESKRPEPALDELAQELRLIDQANIALRAGQPARALQFLAQHAARFPSGALAESRQVTRILALCQSGSAERARIEARQLLARVPNSPYAERVRSACEQP